MERRKSHFDESTHIFLVLSVFVPPRKNAKLFVQCMCYVYPLARTDTETFILLALVSNILYTIHVVVRRNSQFKILAAIKARY